MLPRTNQQLKDRSDVTQFNAVQKVDTVFRSNA